MAATPLTSTKLVRNVEQNQAAAGTATTAGAGNGILITCKKAHKLVMILKPVGAGTMTIKAGTYPPAESAGQGDYTPASAGAGLLQTIVVEPGRFIRNAAGVAQVLVEFSASGDAFWAFEVPA